MQAMHTDKKVRDPICIYSTRPVHLMHNCAHYGGTQKGQDCLLQLLAVTMMFIHRTLLSKQFCDPLRHCGKRGK